MPALKESVRAAISHLPTERIPYGIDVLPPVRAALEKHFRTKDIDRAMGCYLRWLAAPAHWEKVGENLERDEFGVVWSVNELNRCYIAQHPLEKASLDGYAFPRIDYRAKFASLAQEAARSQDAYLVVWVGDLFERAQFLRGLDRLLMDIKLAPGFVHELLDELLAVVLKNAEAICEHPVDAIFLSDDYGLQTDLMMSPADWRTFIKPRLAKIIECGHALGRTVFLHSCGNVRKVIPDLVEIGLDVLHPIQPEAMDIHELKRSFGSKLTFYGGISTQYTMVRGTPDDVRREVREVAQFMGAGGGYILAPGITLQHDVPWDNLLAFIEACGEAKGAIPRLSH